MLDFSAIAQAALSQAEKLLAQWLPDGKRDGKEYVARNPIRGDKTAGSFSVNLRNGIWKDFASGDGGKDLISLYAYLFTNGKQGEAAKALGREFGFPIDGEVDRPHLRANFAPPPPPEPEETPLPFVPPGAPEPSFIHPRLGSASMVWEYRDEEDRLMGYVARYDKDNGDKEVCPRFWFKDHGWKWRGFKGRMPHPIYGLQKLKQKPGQNVLIVEGEKTADAAQRLFPDLIVLSWYGGTAKADRVALDALKGRRVCFWPDFDGLTDKETHEVLPANLQPGTKAALVIADALASLTDEPIFLVDYDPAQYGENSGWDLADAEMEGWDTDAALQYLKRNKREIRVSVEVQPAEAQDPPVSEPEPIKSAPPIPDEPEEVKRPTPNRVFRIFDSNPYFKPLGYLKAENRTVYALWNKRARSVSMFKTSALTLDNLSEVAPLSFWEMTFGAMKKAELTHCVREAIIGASYAKPMYDPAMIRGRGAWTDKSRIVIHLGDRLIVNGHPCDLSDFDSRYMYEGSFHLPLAEKESTAEQGQALIDLCKMFTWDRPVSALYLAGWCFLAPICGALPWRPHIWLTGPASSGKTWINENVLQAMVGDFSLKVQSETTEAGIRQTLGSDALAIVFDEAESETTKADSRIQNVLGLMRQSSSETGGAILKGSADGNARAYRIRSMFSFSSITPGVYQHSDKTRVAMLGLHTHPEPSESVQHFAAVKNAWKAVMTPEFIAGTKRRAVDRIPLVLETFKIFSDELTDFLASRRLADQYGMLLAGAWALCHDRPPTEEEAGSWLIANDWTEETQIMDDHDGMKCLRLILEKPLRVANALGNAMDTTIGELVAVVHRNNVTSIVGVKDAESYLSRYGVKYADGFIYISNSHSALAQLMNGTPWPRNWNKILKHIPGSTIPGKKRFQDSAPIQRCVGVPYSVITDEEEEQ